MNVGIRACSSGIFTDFGFSTLCYLPFMPAPSPTPTFDDLLEIPPWELIAAIPHPSFYFPEHIKTALTEAGFRVGRVRKHDFFHMWSASFYAQESLHGRINEVRRVLRRNLRSKRVPFQNDTFVLSLQGKRGIMAFVLPSEP